MKMLVTSDIHGNRALAHPVRRTVEKRNVDALIVAGDVAHKLLYEPLDTAVEYECYSRVSCRLQKGVDAFKH